MEIPPGAIAFLIAPTRVVRLFHGLRLRYADSETVGQLIPTISVTPTILFRSAVGSRLRVARSSDVFLVPYKYGELSSHLQEVREAAEFLLSRVNQQLGQKLKPADLAEHHADDAFENMPSVEEMRHEADHFRIVTGRFTHFLLPDRNRWPSRAQNLFESLHVEILVSPCRRDTSNQMTLNSAWGALRPDPQHAGVEQTNESRALST